MESSNDWPGSLKPVRTVQEQVMTISGIPDIERPVTQPSKRSRRARIKDVFSLRTSTAEEDLDALEEDLPEAEDEMAPNVAAVLFLQSLSALVSAKEVEWVFNRILFSPRFKNGKYNAHTDGAFRVKCNGTLRGIVEAKKRYRLHPNPNSIKMQESAEVVGWLLKEPDERYPFMNNQ